MNRRKVPNVKRICLAAALLIIGFLVAHAQEPISSSSLCELQKTAIEGQQQYVRVSGVFQQGLERGVLTDSACPNEHGTWVELHLKSERNKDKLRGLLEKSGTATAKIVFIGDFYGPPKPDEKLPPTLKQYFHTGWGHLSAFRTKIVVTEIESVSAVAASRRK